MEKQVNTTFPFKLTPTQATIISFMTAAGFTALALVIAIGYRDSKIGLLILGGVLAGLAAVAIFARPQWGAYLLIITLFTNMSSVFSQNGLPSINKPLVAFVLIAVIINRLAHKRPFPRLRQVELLLLVYGFVWLLSAFGATDKSLALNKVVDFVKDFIVVLTIILALETPRHWRNALWALVLSAAALAAMSTYQVLTGNYAQTFIGFAGNSQEQVLTEVYQSRLTGPLGDPNFYGLILVTAVPLALYFFLDEKRTLGRLTALAATLLLVFALLNTYSRGDFLALVLVLGLIALERKISPSLLAGVAVAALLLLSFLPDSFTDRMNSLGALGSSAETAVYQESSFRGRASEYISGLLMFADHPILGVGANNYPPNYQKYSSRLGLDSRTEEREAHSLYIEIIAETGILGLAAFTALIASLMISLHRARKKLHAANASPRWQRNLTALQMSLIAFLLGSIFLHGAYIYYLWLLIALGAAGIHLAHDVTPKTRPGLVQK